MMCIRFFLAAAFSLSTVASAGTAVAASGEMASPPPLTVRVEARQKLDLSRPVSAFRIVNPEVLDARALDESKVELIGKAPGVSQVVAYDDVGNPVYERQIRVVRAAPRGHGAPGQAVLVQSGTARIVYSCTAGRCFAAGASGKHP